MRGFWDTLFDLDDELSIWVEGKDLGKHKYITHHGKQYRVKIPGTIHNKITLRLRGIGRKRFHKTGDLYLHVWLNEGEDRWASLWLSENAARNGEDKLLSTGEKRIRISIPRQSRSGQVIRLKGLGGKPDAGCPAPLYRRKSGDLLVRLHVYPDVVTPRYRSFDRLSTEQMALEGWVYRSIDQILEKLGEGAFPARPIRADTVADLFNENGWRGIFDALVDHLRLNGFSIQAADSDSIPQPGQCQHMGSYLVTIHAHFVDDPFAVAAILAHELCHIVYSQRIEDRPKFFGTGAQTEPLTREQERMVDLLVFMFKVGEFQLRVARDRRLTLGYFDQETFERMQVIVSRKLDCP
jgi:hypothetical protein